MENSYLCGKILAMRALEFKSKIQNNQIQIPIKIQPELKSNQGKVIRVIVLIDEPAVYDNLSFQEVASREFLEGYAESDSIYDKS